MINLEKIIKGVYDVRRYLEDMELVDKSIAEHIDALNDALTLLKEQENASKRNPAIICPHCGRRLDRNG